MCCVSLHHVGLFPYPALSDTEVLAAVKNGVGFELQCPNQCNQQVWVASGNVILAVDMTQLCIVIIRMLCMIVKMCVCVCCAVQTKKMESEGTVVIVSTAFHVLLCSYNLMLECWKMPPNERPQFATLRQSLEDLLCNMYPYIEVEPAVLRSP